MKYDSLFNSFLIAILEDNDNTQNSRALARVHVRFSSDSKGLGKEEFFNKIWRRFSDSLSNSENWSVEIGELKKENQFKPKEEKNDYRIRNIRMSSIRGYDALKYGLDFHNEIDSSGINSGHIIYGPNGSGKSSLFDSLEYAFCNKIGERNLRNHDSQKVPDDKDYQLYLQHKNTSFNNCKFNITTYDSELGIQSSKRLDEETRIHINSNSHFISNNDIYDFGKYLFRIENEKDLEKSFHTRLAKLLGLNNLYDHYTMLLSFSKFNPRKNVNRLKDIDSSILNFEKNIKDNKSQILELQNQLSNLEANKKVDDNIILQNSKIKLSILEYIDKLIYSKIEINLSEDINQIEKYRNFILRDYNKSSQDFDSSYVQFLQNGLNLLEKYNHCPFCENSKSSNEEIQKKIIFKVSSMEEAKKALENLIFIQTNAIDSIRSIDRSIVNFNSILKDVIQKSSQVSELSDKISAIISLYEISKDFIEGETHLIHINSLPTNPGTKFDDIDFLKTVDYFLDIIPNKVKEWNSKLRILLNNFGDSLSDLIKSFQSELTENNYPITIGEISRQIEKSENDVKNISKQLENLKEEQSNLNAQEKNFGLLKQAARELLPIIVKHLNKEVAKAFDPLEATVNEIFNTFYEEGGRHSFSNSMKLYSMKIKVEKELISVSGEDQEIIQFNVYFANDNIPFPPQRMLNTFHYRLFLTLVALSIAIASRKNSGTNLPIVFDDIFSSADFENHSAVLFFIEKIEYLFEKFTPDIPLQWILFTHDNDIFNSLRIKAKDTWKFYRLLAPDKSINSFEYKNVLVNIPAGLIKNLYKDLRVS